MPVHIATGFEATHLTMFGPAPVGYLRCPLDVGLTTLFGANGAGKSTILRGINRAFAGVRPESGDARVHCRLSNWIHWQGLVPLIAVAVAAERRLGAADADLFKLAQLIIRGEPYALEAEVGELVATLAGKLVAVAELDHPGLVGDPGNMFVTFVPVGASVSEPTWEVYLATEIFDPVLAERVTSNALAEVELPGMPAKNPLAEDVRLLRSMDRSVMDDVVRLTYLATLTDPKQMLRPLYPDDEFDLDARTQDLIVRACETDPDEDPNVPVRLIDSVDSYVSTSFEPSEQLGEIVDALNRYTAKVVELLLPSLLSEVALTINDPNTWPIGPIASWTAVDRYGARVSVDSLGSGTRRWARLAIAMALAGQDSEYVAIFIDEPERALHPTAQVDLAKSLSHLNEMSELNDLIVGSIVVASHSAAFLDPLWRRLHVARSIDGETTADEFDPLAFAGVARELGLTEADLLHLWRVIVIVEGEHDVRVLNRVIGEGLSRHRAVVRRMDGAKRVLTAMELPVVFQLTSIQVRIVLDAVGDTAAALWKEAATNELVDPNAARRALERLSRLPGGETTWLSNAGHEILGRGWMRRINVIGLDRQDIIEYLPVHDLVPGATSWKALRDEYDGDRLPSGPDGKRPDFKTWLRRAKKATLSVADIEHAAGNVDDLADLTKILAGL